MSLLKAVQAVQAYQDKTWIPPEFTEWGYFSPRDVWHYISISDTRRCWNCEQFDGMDFFGDELRSMFPDLVITGEHMISANVHLTLWNQPTCRCRLIRTFFPRVPKLFET
jgi:hypothetical protein